MDGPAGAVLSPARSPVTAPADPCRPSPDSSATPPQPIAAEETPARATRDRPRTAETRRFYASDWATFVAWCRKERRTALPASPATVAAYLAALATLSYGAQARRAAAIADQHRRNGHASPGADPAVRDVLRLARSAARPAGPGASSPPSRMRRRVLLGPAQLARMAARCPGDLAGLRDRALLLLTAAGLGGERLLSLDREHVRLTGHGAAFTVPGDGAGEVVIVARMTGAAACPVRALEDWLRSSDTRFGPVFRKVDRWGTVEHRRMRPDALRRIWQRRAKPPRRRTGP
jgi:hypothetical protein